MARLEFPFVTKIIGINGITYDNVGNTFIFCKFNFVVSFA